MDRGQQMETIPAVTTSALTPAGASRSHPARMVDRETMVLVLVVEMGNITRVLFTLPEALELGNKVTF